jgi:hypothetical protein
MNTLESIDSKGKPIKPGDNVLIMAVPEWLTHDLPEEDAASIKRVEGTIMKVMEIDIHGYIWFGTENVGRWFCLRPSDVQAL